jgi:hypothetical protein
MGKLRESPDLFSINQFRTYAHFFSRPSSPNARERASGTKDSMGLKTKALPPPESSLSHVLEHPLLVHLVRRLVWGAFSSDSKPRFFMVDDERKLVDCRDEPFELREQDQVGLAHRWEICDEEQRAWGTFLSDFELIQPFEQLQREVHLLLDQDRESAELSHWNGKKIESKALLSLKNWQRGEVGDQGVIREF